MNKKRKMGQFYRAVEIRRDGPARMVGEVEDDFHHFRVVLDHDGMQVTGIEHVALRTPWSLCPMAGGQLQALVGKPLTPEYAEALDQGDIRSNCTHMYDLACILIAHAARGTALRRYDMAVADRVEGRTHGTLRRDDGFTMAYDVDGTEITAPPPFAGLSLKRGFPQWATRHLPRDDAEAAIVLRRAIFVSNGRRRDLDDSPNAAVGARNIGGCFVMREGVADRALRIMGASRDYTDSDAKPLADGIPL